MKPLIELKDCKAYQETEGAINNYNNLKGKTISFIEMDEDGSFYRIHFTSGDWADFSSSIDMYGIDAPVVRSILIFVPVNAELSNSESQIDDSQKSEDCSEFTKASCSTIELLAFPKDPDKDGIVLSSVQVVDNRLNSQRAVTYALKSCQLLIEDAMRNGHKIDEFGKFFFKRVPPSEPQIDQ